MLGHCVPLEKIARFKDSEKMQAAAATGMNFTGHEFSLAQFHIERTIPARSTRAKDPFV